MSLQNKILCLCGLIFTVFLAVIGWRLGDQLETNRRAAAEQQIALAIENVQRISQQRALQLAGRAEQLATVATAEAILDLPSAMIDEWMLQHATTDDQLVALVDADGRVVSSSIPRIPRRSELSDELLAAEQPISWTFGSLQVEALTRAISGADESPRGFVLVGLPIEPATYSLSVEDRVSVAALPSGFDTRSAPGVPEAVVETARMAPNNETVVVEMGSARWMIRRLSETATGKDLTFVMLDDGESAECQAMWRDFMLTGVVALGLTLLAGWLIGRRMTHSIHRLAGSVEDAAQAEDPLQEVHSLQDASPETRRLQVALGSLLETFDESQRDRERSYVEAVGALVAAIDLRDHEVIGHSFRVAHYSVALAREMGISGDQLRAVEWGSLLHDVGKIAIPDAILRKNGSLTEEEWHIMRQHPNWGFEMLADVKFLRSALEIVYSHHEQWDGGGYPRGLSDKEIPLAARIFAVVDTYDSITSDRPYRRARSHQAAINELCRVAGSQLDPSAVDAFIRIPETELRRLREISAKRDLRMRLPSELAFEIAEGNQQPKRSKQANDSGMYDSFDDWSNPSGMH